MSEAVSEALVIDERRIAVAGGEIYLKQWRPSAVAADIAPIVLLHDSLGCVGLWRDFPAALAATLQRPVIAYDRLGFGQSSLPASLPGQDFIEDEARSLFPQLREALGLRQYWLFGHSVGGSMALAIAAEKPEACLGVVSESAQPYVEQRTLDGVSAAKANFARPEQLARLQRWHGDKARWVLDAWIETWLDPVRADWRLDPVLAQVSSPVLAIHGEADEFGSTQFATHIAASVAGPSQVWIIANGGHVPHKEMPEQVLSRVTEFVSG